MALWIVDILLVLGATLRVTRLVTTDDLGYWLVRRPAYRWAPSPPASTPATHMPSRPYEPQYEPVTWRQKIVSGLDCPFCVGFWLGAGVLASLALAGGPAHAHELWRYAAGALTLNYVIAHISARMDD